MFHPSTSTGQFWDRRCLTFAINNEYADGASEDACHDATKPLSLISILVNFILSWTPRGTTCLPRGTAQIALLSIGIYFLFSAFFVSNRRNRLPHVTIGLRP